MNEVSRWQRIVTSRLVGLGMLLVFVMVNLKAMDAQDRGDTRAFVVWLLAVAGVIVVMGVILGQHVRRPTWLQMWVEPVKTWRQRRATRERTQERGATRERKRGSTVGYKDLIEDQLRERSVEIGGLSWRQKQGRKRSTSIIGSVLFFVGVPLLLAGLYGYVSIEYFLDDGEVPSFAPRPTLAEWQEDRDWVWDATGYMGITGLILSSIGVSMKANAERALAQQEAERDQDLALRRQFATMTMTQRVEVLSQLSAIEIARLQSIGVVTAEEARQAEAREERRETRKEAKRVRDWQSGENQKDRELKIEELITRFEGEIEKLETRMQYESPNASKKVQEELITLEGRVAQLKKINKIKDPTLRKQMFDEFKRGWK